MVWALARPAAVHVHAYSGHDHGDHDHGPATHDHDRPAPSSDEGEPRLSSCDPADHVIFLSVATTTAMATFTLPFEVVELYALPVRSPRGGIVPPIDARQHSPPRFTPLSPRAPPFSATA